MCGRGRSVISFVNGYLCTSCCDAAKAKRGEDPHPTDDPSKPGYNPAHAKHRPGQVNADGPAVVFGGVLAGLIGTDKPYSPVAAAASSAPSSAPPTTSILDILA